MQSKKQTPIEEMPLVWRKCDHWVQYGGTIKINQVRLDIDSGSAFTEYEGEYYWSPIYKSCCTFAHDENFENLIDTKNAFPHLNIE